MKKAGWLGGLALALALMVTQVAPWGADSGHALVDASVPAPQAVEVTPDATFQNPIAPIDTPDPSMVYKDGFYYFTFTHNGADIEVWKSPTISMQNATKVTVWSPPPAGEYSAHIWAPELQWLNNRWYIYFAASDTNMDHHKMYVLESVGTGAAADAQGAYTFKGKIAAPTDKWAIDGVVFEQKGSLYMVWSGWEGDVNVQQNLYIAPMSNPYTISGERVKISQPQYVWEKKGGPPYINEAPEILKRNGKIFLVYSASGSWTPDYCLGMLTLNETANPLIPSNWVKARTPVFSRNDAASVYGPGHNTFTTSPDGTQDWIVYHATTGINDGWSNRTARGQRFTWNKDGTPNFGVPQSLSVPQEIPGTSGGITKLQGAGIAMFLLATVGTGFYWKKKNKRT